MADNRGKPSAFGTSLRLVDGDLVVDGGDLQTITGRPNFLQAVQVIIETGYDVERRDQLLLSGGNRRRGGTHR